MPTEAPRFRGWFSEIRRLANGSFPGFVTSRGDDCAVGLPVFVHHTISAAGFEAELRFLCENRYESLDADSFLAILTGRREHRGNEVLLTIDDARTSAWVWAYPLLKKYGHRAVVFVIPGCVSDRRRPIPRLGDRVDTNAAQPVQDRDPDLMSWEELRIAQEDGVFDIQSHTLFHRQIPVSPDVEDFITPDQAGPFYAVPVPRDIEVRSDNELRRLAGLPLYRSQPLLGSAVIWEESPDVLKAPMKLVQRRGRDAFFRQGDWRPQLFAAVRDAQRSSQVKGRFLEPAEVRATILKELTESKTMIEEQLGETVRHLCLPFAAGSELAMELAKEAGYQGVFGGTRTNRSLNTVGDDPFYCVRLKHDYVFRLPGRGRRPLASILLGKVVRRLRGKAVY